MAKDLRTPHFAHFPGAPACNSAGETAEHLAIKEWLAEMFARKSWVQSVELEWQIDRGARRADLWLETRYGPVALEVQHSGMTIGTIQEKLRDYTARAIPCLYIVPAGTATGRTGGAAPEIRLPAWLQWLHDVGGNKLHVAVPLGGGWGLEVWRVGTSGRVQMLPLARPAPGLWCPMYREANGAAFWLAEFPLAAPGPEVVARAGGPPSPYYQQRREAYRQELARRGRPAAAALTARQATLAATLQALEAAAATRFIWLQEIWECQAERAAIAEWLAAHPGLATPVAPPADPIYAAWLAISALDAEIQKLDRQLGPRKRRLGEAQRAAILARRAELVAERAAAVAHYERIQSG